jgi:hypothetical protein|tara:strand:+ start:246 stop:410 length:165 start_codon:yes stop_codon:yes gene_type:complete
LDPKNNTYTVLYGKEKRSKYTSKSGDFLVNIDRENLGELVKGLNDYEKFTAPTN